MQRDRALWSLTGIVKDFPHHLVAHALRELLFVVQTHDCLVAQTKKILLAPIGVLAGPQRDPRLLRVLGGVYQLVNVLPLVHVLLRVDLLDDLWVEDEFGKNSTNECKLHERRLTRETMLPVVSIRSRTRICRARDRESEENNHHKYSPIALFRFIPYITP